MTAPSTTAQSSTTPEPPNPALTTPYVFPPECTNIYNLTSGSTLTYDFASLAETYLYVNTIPTTLNSSSSTSDSVFGQSVQDSNWATCQPAGRRVITEHNYQTAYSGIVCPSSWIAWSVGLQSRFLSYDKNGPVSSTWSTAFCCGGGHTLVDDIWSIYSDDFGKKVCIETFSPKTDETSPTGYPLTNPTYVSSYPYFVFETTAGPSTSSSSSPRTSLLSPTSSTPPTTITLSATTTLTRTTTFTQGRAFYPPMSLHWLASDNPTLSPPWPTLTSDMLIPSFVPGNSQIPSGVFENKGQGPWSDPLLAPSFRQSWALPVLIVLGVLLLFSLLGMTLLGWKLWRLRRRVRAVEEKGGGVRGAEGGVLNGPVGRDGNGTGTGTVNGNGDAPDGGAATRTSVANGERARIVDVGRARGSNPI